MDEFATYPSLKDKVVYISGGTTGIGAHVVEHFAAQGSRVGFVGRNEAAAAAVIDGCTKNGWPAPMFQRVDVTDIAALRASIVATASALGPINVLVNNAANDQRHTMEEVTPEYWDERMNVNLRHQFFAIQAVVGGMRAAGGGSIINLGSISWMLKVPDMPAYTTAKAAIQGLTRTMAKYLGPDNIRVNAVVPGWIITQRQLDHWLTPEAEQEMLEGQCLKRRLYPPELARMILFLAADDSSACTSQSYIVDGGWAGL